MTLNLQNIGDAKKKLNRCNVAVFDNTGNSFRHFIKKLKINSFRHINNIELSFDHPVTVISGTNKIGKTSLLLILACSHEEFKKIDATAPAGELRNHAWKDVLSFTSKENETKDYSYEIDWRVAKQDFNGEGKRLAKSGAWSGLGKKSSSKRTNAKIKVREVRLIDLERILPARSFSSTLYRKANASNPHRLNIEIEQAFEYIFNLSNVKISEMGSHINKTCYSIQAGSNYYSTYNAASGEESAINLLKDIFESAKDSLVLIDELEAGFHPSVLRKIADIIQYIAWRDKKQFIITTHSPSLLSSFPKNSRKFIESHGDEVRVIKGISVHAALSKMDAIGYPLINLYCEDDIASYLIKKIMIKIAQTHAYFDRLINIIESGPVNEVKTDYERHKRNFPQLKNKVGYCAIIDGDYKNDSNYSNYHENSSEKVMFLYPYEAPEKFLLKAYLKKHPNANVEAEAQYTDHHSYFQMLVNHSLATDDADAKNKCYESFKDSAEHTKHEEDIIQFLKAVVTEFSI
ncbi:AAA family ATPase [Methylophilus sp.]|uniref:AAA family ATPase n=1 Tax=Methylophilus sp. TaxID=29541 RepID=UPI0025FF42AA|nr:AAA family ATPase [Methylophilus sp.]